MRDRLVKLLATGFGAGYFPQAPGLAGSMVGLGYWWLVGDYWPIIAGLMLLAVWVTGKAATIIKEKDPACVVLDEIVAVPVAVAGVTGWWVVLAFVLFRVFDVWKPWPIRPSQKLPGGWGIVVDDLLAAGAACGFTHLVTWATR
jgi:phosphatidylglycerophosphatase A